MISAFPKRGIKYILAHLITVILYFSLLFAQVSSDGYQVRGEVEGGNYTYYTLNTEGRFILTLISEVGDADIYVSDSKIHPNFEVDGNCLQSVTCGIDEVEISPHLNRPIGIGIYGHPTQLKSKYSLQLKPLSFESNSRYESLDTEYEVNNNKYEYMTSNKYKATQKPQSKPAEDESILWTIFVGLLKILLDILT